MKRRRAPRRPRVGWREGSRKRWLQPPDALETFTDLVGAIVLTALATTLVRSARTAEVIDRLGRDFAEGLRVGLEHERPSPPSG